LAGRDRGKGGPRVGLLVRMSECDYRYYMGSTTLKVARIGSLNETEAAAVRRLITEMYGE